MSENCTCPECQTLNGRNAAVCQFPLISSRYKANHIVHCCKPAEYSLTMENIELVNCDRINEKNKSLCLYQDKTKGTTTVENVAACSFHADLWNKVFALITEQNQPKFKKHCKFVLYNIDAKNCVSSKYHSNYYGGSSRESAYKCKKAISLVNSIEVTQDPFPKNIDFSSRSSLRYMFILHYVLDKDDNGISSKIKTEFENFAEANMNDPNNSPNWIDLFHHDERGKIVYVQGPDPKNDNKINVLPIIDHNFSKYQTILDALKNNDNAIYSLVKPKTEEDNKREKKLLKYSQNISTFQQIIDSLEFIKSDAIRQHNNLIKNLCSQIENCKEEKNIWDEKIKKYNPY